MTAPTPLEKRRSTGNHRDHAPITPSAVIEGSVDQIPNAPAHLGAAGTRRWDEVWSVADKWLVPTLDVSLLVRYCEAHDDRAAYKAIVKKDGRISRGSTGQPKVHPAIEQIDRIDSALLRMEDALGFHPVSRARLHVEKKQAAPARKLDKYVTRSG
jgi:P27 family predicted phage terminase small subunit